MSSKLKFVLPAVFLVFCLIVLSGFAAELSSMVVPNSILIDQTNVLGMDEDRTATFYINNVEVFDLIVNVTNSTNLTHESNTSGFMSFKFDFVNGTQVNAMSTSSTSDVEVTMNSSNASQSGSYSGWIEFMTCDIAGGNVQTYQMPVVVNLSETINMTILSATNLADSDVIQPGDAMKINVSTSYWNGDFISGLTEKNFTSTISHVYESELTNANDSTSLNITGYVENADSYTLIAEALPETLFGGDYSITVSLLNTTFTGSDTATNEFAIYQTALKMNLVDCSATNSIYVGGGSNTTTCGFNLINYGYKTATNINVTYNINPVGGLSVNPINQSVLFDLAELANYTNSTTVTGLTTGTRYLYFNAITSDDVKWDVQNISAEYIVSVSTTTPDPGPDPDPSPDPGSPGIGSGDDLTGGFSHKLEVTGPDTFTLVQGKSSTKTIIVKNTGSFTEIDVKLSISGIPSSWYMVETGEQNVIIALSKEYKVQIKAPKDAEPKIYTLKFKAANSQTEGSASTTLKVMPSEDTKVEIAANYVNYSSWFDTMMKAYNGTSLSEENATEVESLLNQITGLLTKADAHIGLGEYFEAYNSLSEVRTLLMEAEDILGVQGSGMEFLMEERLIIVAVLVAFVAIGAGLYFATKSGKINLKMPNMPGRSRRSFGGKSDVTLKLKQKHAGIKLKAEEMRKNLKKKKDRLKQGNFSFKLRGQGE